MKNKKDSPWSAHVSLTWSYPQPSEAGKVENPNEIGPKIARLTEILLQARGKNATFESEHSILIELVSADVPDLTIIDLPGIVRTTLEGQSKTVVVDVDSLLQRYLEQKRTIILAVIPSNVDIATVDIIERASKADPNGDRTVGVLTKPDMIGEGAEQEKVDTLLNINKPLKLGYVMVKNRSQKQIDDDVTLEEAKQIERAWFAGHQHFRSLDPSLFGVDNLAKKLTDILVDRIKDSIPHLHKEITQLLERTSQDLEALGPCPPTTVDDMRAALMNYLMLVANDVKSAISGNYDSSVLQDNPKTRIFARFRMFAYDFNQSILTDKPQWTVEEVKTAIREMRGRELPGFPKFSVFEHLVRGYVERWRLAAQKLLSDSRAMAAEACDEVVEHHVPQFRRLSSALRALLQDLLAARAQGARADALEALVANELAPMTENHYFMDTYNKSRTASFERVLDRAFERVPLGYLQTTPTAIKGLTEKQYADLRAALVREYSAMSTVGTEPNETQEAEDLRAMLHAYWKASSKRFVDTAIQTVDRVLLKGLEADAVARFAPAGLPEPRLAELFAEEHQVREGRSRLEAKAARLRSAYAVLGGLGV